MLDNTYELGGETCTLITAFLDAINHEPSSSHTQRQIETPVCLNRIGQDSFAFCLGFIFLYGD